MKYVKLNLDSLGILSGFEKRALTKFVSEKAFKRRKNYDEFYCSWGEDEINIDVDGLMELGKVFEVKVTKYEIVLSK